MNKFGLTFHHLGLAVRLPDDAAAFLSGMGYEIGSTVSDPLQHVNLIMCKHPDMPDVEIIFKGEENSPIDNIVKQHDALIYHSCYETSNLDNSLKAMEAAGHKILCISKPKEAILFDGRYVSFYHIKNFGIIELIEGR